MTEEKRAILEKAKELSKLLAENEVTKRYAESQKCLSESPSSRETLLSLIELGRVLSEKGNSGESVTADETAENKLLQEKLENDQIVKDFVSSQKAYLSLIKEVQTRIQNPQ